eukprot:2532305-Prymnesium_polylepis.1
MFDTYNFTNVDCVPNPFDPFLQARTWKPIKFPEQLFARVGLAAELPIFLQRICRISCYGDAKE